jgi:hypothetical protein
MFVDVDDYLLPDTLKDAMTVVEENPDADFFIFGITAFQKKGKTLINDYVNINITAKRY